MSGDRNWAPDAGAPRPRVFVSSVMDGFGAIREAARRGIVGAGGDPVLVEDIPSLATSPRNACLDAIETCELLLVVVGERGGYTAPSGRTVVEEEVDHARRLKLPVLVFIQNVERDRRAEELCGKLSDYVDGRFRSSFDGPIDLKDRVHQSLSVILPSLSGTTNSMHMMQDLLSESVLAGRGPAIRLCLAPIRQAELFDPMKIAEESFQRAILSLGHRSDVGLFDFGLSSSCKVEPTSLSVRESCVRGDRKILRVGSSGDILIDAEIARNRDDRDPVNSVFDSMVIARADLENVLAPAFRFCGALFVELDQYGRFELFKYSVAIHSSGRQLVDTPPVGSFSMSMHQGDGPIIPFPTPRQVNRSDLLAPGDEVHRIVEITSRMMAS